MIILVRTSVLQYFDKCRRFQIVLIKISKHVLLTENMFSITLNKFISFFYSSFITKLKKEGQNIIKTIFRISIVPKFPIIS